MGRHTGFLIVALLTGFAVSTVALRTKSLQLQPGLAPINDSSGVCPGTDMTAVSTERNSTVILNSLRPDSLLIIGSLDSSGAPHPIRITVRSVANGNPQPAPTTTVPLHTAVLSHALSEPDRLDLDENRDGSILPTTSQIIRHRNFRVPRFESSGTRRELCEATIVSESPRVSVYLEDNLLTDFDATLRFRSDLICELLENQVLALINEAMGPVADIDADGTLSIVIADLDRQSGSQSPPVRGCVTDQDFLPEGQTDFSGDVIYLDRHLPEEAALASLLAHELTHAAILSYQLQLQQQASEVRTTDASGSALRSSSARRIPSWLNEAAAHWMEHRLTPEVPGFAERIATFQSASATAPVVASDDYLTFASRRSGSRAAGYLFLKSLLKSDRQLRDFVLNDQTLEERIERVTGSDFRQAFRHWMIEAAGIIEPETVGDLAGPEIVTQSVLYGTAVISIRLHHGAQSVAVSSDRAAQLEVMTR
ncbi:MAG: hypothetical protein ACK58L_12780 [Planctomycetota bacterium]